MLQGEERHVGSFCPADENEELFSEPPLFGVEDEESLHSVLLEERRSGGDWQRHQEVLHLLDGCLDRWRADMTTLRRDVEASFTLALSEHGTAWTATATDDQMAFDAASCTSSAVVPVSHAVTFSPAKWTKEHVHKNFQAAHRRSMYFQDTDTGLMTRPRSYLSAAYSKTRASLEVKRLHLRSLEALVEHRYFLAAVFAVIVLNTVAIGLDASFDVEAAFEHFDALNATVEDPAPTDRKSPEDVAQVFEFLEDAFFYFYTFELVLRILAHEGLFLVGPEWRWNWFDAVIVSVSILERFVTTGAGSSAFRLLRILKLSRSARSVRLLRMFPSMCPLQFLLLSCKNSLPALCWTCVLLLVLLFLFSAVLTSPVAYFVTQLPHNDPIAETLRYHFGSMSMCMLTLFLTFLGEVDFREVILVLLEVDLAWCALYVAFVLFATLAMTNIVAGIFIADAMELTSQDRDIRQRGELVRSRKNLQLLTALFHEMDALGTGLISQSDFEEQLQRPEVLSLLSYFNLDVTDATAFFTLLDADEDGFVDIEEFTVGCLRMHGKSNAIDMEISIQETKRLALSIDRALQQDTEKIENRIEKVSRTSHGHEVKLLGMICTMEASLRSIEERLGIRDVETAFIES